MRRFDYSFLRDLMVPAGLMTRVSMIEGLRARNSYSRNGHEPVLTDMYGLSQLLSVQACRRAGRLYTDDKHLVDLFFDRCEPSDYDDSLLLGYRDALRLIHMSHSEMSLSADTIRSIYSVLVSYTGEPADFRMSESSIMLLSADGSPHYMRSPVHAEDVPWCMDQLIRACSEAKADLGINRYLLIPCFMLDFLCIQPYEKHNGMMARLCVILLMYRMGLEFQRYVSFDQSVYMYLQSHYDAFFRSSAGWDDGSNDYVPYIEEFARDVFICMGFFERRMRGMAGSNEKSLRVYYQAISTPLSLSKRDLCELMPDISETTVELALSQLVASGKIRRTGGKRNSRYIRAVDRWY